MEERSFDCAPRKDRELSWSCTAWRIRTGIWHWQCGIWHSAFLVRRRLYLNPCKMKSRADFPLGGGMLTVGQVNLSAESEESEKKIEPLEQPSERTYIFHHRFILYQSGRALGPARFAACSSEILLHSPQHPLLQLTRFRRGPVTTRFGLYGGFYQGRSVTFADLGRGSSRCLGSGKEGKRKGLFWSTSKVEGDIGSKRSTVVRLTWL